ncbi:hypothetical protein M422DRAFT_43230 [Sphaerobolus stellatus SS14]|nr:hypothetical protein M422DRAFT_43230 [Sphaerobolus stellatus SS14]
MAEPSSSQPGPSKPPSRQFPTSSTKRKAPNDEDKASTFPKRTKSSQSNTSADKSTGFRGERKPGGLIIKPLQPVPPKGKGKQREIPTATQEELEIDEEVKQMEAKTERLRVREAQAQAQATDLNTSIPPSQLKQLKQPVNRRSTPLMERTIDMMQPLPVRDTPVADRNRLMRGELPDRRSSLTRRGKRASSSFENKGIIPLPHKSLSPSNFHKHIDRELPEAHRARQLLVWCASRMAASSSRTISSKISPPLPPLTAEGVKMLEEVQKEVQKMLTEKTIDIIFSHRMDEDANRPKIKSHEQNVKNLKREDDFMRYIDRCKREAETWESMKHSYNARQASALDLLARQQKANQSHEWIPPDPSDELYAEELEIYQLARQTLESQTRKRADVLQLRMAETECKVDRVHAAVHVGAQFAKSASRHLDKHFHALAMALASRSRPETQPAEVSRLSRLVSNDPNPPSATGLGAPPDTMDMLRALARADMEHPRTEVADATRKAARDVQRVNATPGRNTSKAGPSGERRLTAVGTRGVPGTPRRPGTPRQRSEGPEGGPG